MGMKSKHGELKLSHFLTDHGYPGRKGQQFSQSPDSPDVVFHRRNNKPWLTVLSAEQFLELIKGLQQ